LASIAAVTSTWSSAILGAPNSRQRCEKALLLSDGQIRFIGLTFMVIGVLLLYLWR
jgi:uncharacterized protein YjeT (DUF2065 family)